MRKFWRPSLRLFEQKNVGISKNWDTRGRGRLHWFSWVSPRTMIIKQKIPNNFQLPEIVGSGSNTQLQVGEKLNKLIDKG